MACLDNGWCRIGPWYVSTHLLALPWAMFLLWGLIELPHEGERICTLGGQQELLRRACARCSDGCTDATYMDYIRLGVSSCDVNFLELIPELGPNVLNCESGTLVTGANPGSLSASIYSTRRSVLWGVGNDTSLITKQGAIPRVIRDDVVAEDEYDTNLLIASGNKGDFVRAHGSASDWRARLNYEMNFDQWNLLDDRSKVKRAYMRSVDNMRPFWRSFFEQHLVDTLDKLALRSDNTALYEDIIMSTMNATCWVHLANDNAVCDHDTVRLFYEWARTTGTMSKYTKDVARQVMDIVQTQTMSLLADPEATRFRNTFTRQWLVVLPEHERLTPKQARLEVMHNILASGAQMSNLVAQTIRAHVCASDTANGDCGGIPHGFMGSGDDVFVKHTHFTELMRWVSPGLPFTIGSAMSKTFQFPAEADVWDPSFQFRAQRAPLCKLKVNTMPTLSRWLVGAERHSSIGSALRVANRALVPRGNRFEVDRYARPKGLLQDGNDPEYDVMPSETGFGPRGEVPGTNNTVVSHRRGWAPFGTGYRRCPGESFILDALHALHKILSSGKFTFELKVTSVESNSFAFLGLAPKDGLFGKVLTHV